MLSGVLVIRISIYQFQENIFCLKAFVLVKMILIFVISALTFLGTPSKAWENIRGYLLKKAKNMSSKIAWNK